MDSYVVDLDEDTPPGEYQIEVGMYEHTTGQRLPMISASGAPNGDSAVLAELTVVH